VIFRICRTTRRQGIDRFEHRRADLPVGDELEANFGQLTGVLGLDLSVDRSESLKRLLKA
jgi:hypothetical protein